MNRLISNGKNTWITKYSEPRKILGLFLEHDYENKARAIIFAIRKKAKGVHSQKNIWKYTVPHGA
jgi:hypothetical protein